MFPAMEAVLCASVYDMSGHRVKTGVVVEHTNTFVRIWDPLSKTDHKSHAEAWPLNSPKYRIAFFEKKG